MTLEQYAKRYKLSLVNQGFQRQGFTLVEILAVIAVMGIMGAFLNVAFSKARESGRQAACIGNLKNLGQAFQMYAEDHRLKFPYSGGWYTFLQSEYLDNNDDVFICPSAPNLAFGANMGYGMNYNLSFQYTADYNARTTEMVLEIDGRDVVTNLLLISGRHNDGSNRLYVDGSIRWIQNSSAMVTDAY